MKFSGVFDTFRERILCKIKLCFKIDHSLDNTIISNGVFLSASILSTLEMSLCRMFMREKK